MKRFWLWLGARDCRKGKPARFSNAYYLKAYARQYAIDEHISYFCDLNEY